MPGPLTLIVHIQPDGSDLAEVGQAVDAQTLRYASFEVAYVAADAPAATWDRLAELARRRPNVTVARSAAEAMSASTAEWFVTVPTRFASRLQPGALERLIGFAGEHDCDVVVGRVDAENGNQVCDRFVTDLPRATDLPPDLLSSLVLVARTVAESAGLPEDVASASAVLDAATGVGVMGAYPCVVLAEPKPAPPALRITSASTSWSAGRLTVAIEGTADPGSTVRFAARSGVREHWLPGTTVTGSNGAVTATTTIDVRTAIDGAPLGPGPWLVTVGAHGDGGDWARRVPVPTTALKPGIVGGVKIAPGGPPKGREVSGLILDIGATRGSLVPPFSPERARFTESAGGTVLRVPLDVHAIGDARVPGYVALDGLRFPASIEVENGTATLVAHLSGLPGTAALGTGFGRSFSTLGGIRDAGPETPTGMSVEFSPVGLMRLVPTPTKGAVARAEPEAAGARARSRPDERRPGGPDGKPGRPAPRPRSAQAPSGLRRWVPPALEPAVLAMAQNPTVRRIFRQLARRSGSADAAR